MSIAGGYYKAVEAAAAAGCDVVQVFTKSCRENIAGCLRSVCFGLDFAGDTLFDLLHFVPIEFDASVLQDLESLLVHSCVWPMTPLLPSGYFEEPVIPIVEQFDFANFCVAQCHIRKVSQRQVVE